MILILILQTCQSSPELQGRSKYTAFDRCKGRCALFWMDSRPGFFAE